MSRSFRDWIGEGEEIYRNLVEEFQRSEQQLAELEQQLASKVQEVNELAEVIGKPRIAAPRRLPMQGEVIDPPSMPPLPSSGGSTSGNIARAITSNVAVKLL